MDKFGDNDASMLGNDAQGFVDYDSLGDIIHDYKDILLNNPQPVQHGLEGIDGFNDHRAVDRSDHVAAYPGPQGGPINMQVRSTQDYLQPMLPPIPQQFDDKPIPGSAAAAKRIRALEQAISEIRTQKKARRESVSIGTANFYNCGPSNTPIGNPQTLPSGYQYQAPSAYSNIPTYPNNMAGGSGETSNPNPPPAPTANPVPDVINIQTWTSSKIYLHVGEGMAYIGVCTLHKSDLLPAICATLENHNIIILSVKSSSHGNWRTFFIKVQTTGPTPEQILNGVTAAQLYKEAADEIALIV
ncbi:hypothetical protein CDL15_Pgr003376 [Punica granatum]|uniref:Uncharacterized protein n=1 Tax=Punica granatum TaxID=22663 RepID=A0A218X2P6_PUNGR|nr:hypothetical protein CDL15_Pgr003376 [Punica granatum]